MTVDQYEELKTRVLARGPIMTHQEFLTAAIQDARQAYQSYQSMRSEELLHLQAVRQVGQDNATTPEDLVYNGGRLALIAAILKHRNADGRT